METYLEEIEFMESGAPMAEVLQLIENIGMTQKQFVQLAGISVSTFSERKKAARLNPGESELYLRIEKAFSLATEVFDNDPEAARGWMTSNLAEFKGRTPLSMLKTGFGFFEVMNLLHCIEHGVYL